LLAANHIRPFDPRLSVVVSRKIDWMAMANFFQFLCSGLSCAAVDAFPVIVIADRATIRTAPSDSPDVSSGYFRKAGLRWRAFGARRRRCVPEPWHPRIWPGFRCPVRDSRHRSLLRQEELVAFAAHARLDRFAINSAVPGWTKRCRATEVQLAAAFQSLYTALREELC
jgi:hypothetical protein